MKRYYGLIAILVITVLMVTMIVSCANPSTPTAPPTTSAKPAPTTAAPAPTTAAPAPTTAAPAPTTAPPAPTTAAGVVTLRLTLPNPPGDELTVADEALAAAFAKDTNGRYVIKIEPGETMIKLPETYDAVRTGAAEMADIGMGIFEGMDPRLAELPFTVNNIRANEEAAWPFAQLCSANVHEKKLNMKVLGCYATGGQELWSTKPIKTLADWKGLLCGSSNPESSSVIQGLGGAPVPMSWTDFYTGLQKKTVDAVLNSIRGSIVFKIPDVAKYLTLCYSTGTYLAYVINLDTWNKMPPDIQKILSDDCQAAAAKMQQQQIQEREQTDLNTVKGFGVNVYDLPKDEYAKWKAALDPYTSKRLADMGDFGVQEKALLDKANADNPLQ
jgi:TRAP-type C4-dicarboxylate transport system substrate-binding protein